MSSIAKNTAFLTIASVGQKIISFVYFTIIARLVGVEDTGKYFFALAFTTIFVVFVDLGLTNVLVRESAKIRERTQAYFSTIISVKIVLGLLAYLAAFITINLLGYSLEIKHLIYLSAVTMLTDSLQLSIYGTLRALNDLKYEAIGVVGSQLITLILGSIFLYLKLPLIYLILAFTIPSFLNAVFAAVCLFSKYNIKLIPKFDWKIFRYLGRIAIPFALAAIFARVYGYIDSIMLSKMIGDTAVGWYSIPFKISTAFQFIPLALVATLYPRFSENFVNDRQKLARIFERGIKYLLIVAFPIVVGIGVLARPIVLTIYNSGYTNSILPLQILIIGLIFSFVSFPIGAILNACDQQGKQTSIVGIVMVLNILLNLILIPPYGVLGASITALVGNIFLALMGYCLIPRITKISHWFIGKTIIQLIVSTGVMGGLVWYVNQELNFVWAILCGILVYPVMLFITRTVTISQLREAYDLMKK